MKNNTPLDLLLKTKFDDLVEWIDFFQDDFETDKIYYFFKTQAITDNIALYYFLCREKSLDGRIFNSRDIRKFKLLPGENKIGLVQIETMESWIRLLGIPEKQSLHSTSWIFLKSAIEQNFPGFIEYSNNSSNQDEDQNGNFSMKLDKNAIKKCPKTVRTLEEHKKAMQVMNTYDKKQRNRYKNSQTDEINKTPLGVYRDVITNELKRTYSERQISRIREEAELGCLD